MAIRFNILEKRKEMARPVGPPLEKVTLNLLAGDKQVLEQYYHVMGWSVAARSIIHNVCNKLREMDSQFILSDAADIEVEVADPEELKDGN